MTGATHQRVLVTGAFGSLGMHTLRPLLKMGHSVIALDLDRPRRRRAAARFRDRARVILGDIEDAALLEQLLASVDVVVHLAAVVPPLAPDDMARAERVNVHATLKLVELMEQSPGARRLVFASSTQVFGDVQDREPPVRVDTQPRPTDAFGRQKLACEEAIRASGLKWSILRVSVAAPIDVLHHERNPAAAFAGSADGRVELVHPADVGLAFARAVTCAEATGRILYIGGGEGCRLRAVDLINELSGTIGIDGIPASAFRQADVPMYFGDWVDTEDSQRLLNYQHHDLEQLKADMRRSAGCLPLLVRPVKPLARWFLLRRSPYYRRRGLVA